MLDDFFDAGHISCLLSLVSFDLFFQPFVLSTAFRELSPKHINILPLYSCLALRQLFFFRVLTGNGWDFSNFFRHGGFLRVTTGYRFVGGSRWLIIWLPWWLHIGWWRNEYRRDLWFSFGWALEELFDVGEESWDDSKDKVREEEKDEKVHHDLIIRVIKIIQTTDCLLY